MSAARTLARAMTALATAAVLMLAPALPAAAEELGAEWGGDTVNLAWDGSTYATVTENFVGLPVTVPGDRAFRTLVVTNDGSTPGVLRAWIVDVGIDGPGGAASRFFDDVRVDWHSESAASSASLRSLAAADRTRVARIELAAGESTELTIGYEFPTSSTAGNESIDGELSASFDVLLRLEGDTGDDDGPDDDDDDGDDDDGDDSPPDDRLPETGAQIGLTALVAALLAGGGMLLVILTRRRRRSHE